MYHTNLGAANEHDGEPFWRLSYAAGEPLQHLARILERIPTKPEQILTASGETKLLAVIEEYLVWYEELPSSDGAIVPISATQKVERIVGLACISGMVCQDWLPSQATITAESPELGAHNKVPYSQSLPKPMNGSSTVLGIQLKATFNSSAGEILLFHNLEHKQSWRTKIARACVFFADLVNRFEYKSQIGHKRGSRVLCVKNKESNSHHILRLKEVEAHIGNFTASDTPKNGIVHEAKILVRLQYSGISARFQELVQTREDLGIVEEFLDAIPFTDWFRDTWCFGLGGAKDSLPVLGLLLELSRLIRTLHDHGVSHENISKENICVKITDNLHGETMLSESPHINSASTIKSTTQPKLAPVASIRNSSFIQKLMQ